MCGAAERGYRRDVRPILPPFRGRGAMGIILFSLPFFLLLIALDVGYSAWSGRVPLRGALTETELAPLM